MILLNFLAQKNQERLPSEKKGEEKNLKDRETKAQASSEEQGVVVETHRSWTHASMEAFLKDSLTVTLLYNHYF